MNDILNYSGWIATVISFGIAIYQISVNRKLIRKQKEDIWKQIEQIKGTMRGLEESPLSYGGRIKQNIGRKKLDELLLEGKHNLVDYEAITVAEENLLATFRNQLQQAVSLEKKFSLDLVQKWYKTGKLSSRWQVRQACQLLDMTHVSEPDLETHKELLIACGVSMADETNINCPR